MCHPEYEPDTSVLRASLGSGITSLYSMILVAIYLASSFTEIVTFPAHHLGLKNQLNINRLFNMFFNSIPQLSIGA